MPRKNRDRFGFDIIPNETKDNWSYEKSEFYDDGVPVDFPVTILKEWGLPQVWRRW